MMSDIRRWSNGHVRFAIVIAVAGIAAWSAVIIPSGMQVGELIAFAAPAAVLALFTRWLTFAFAPHRWRWSSGVRAALVGIALLPPLLAAFVTLAGLQRPTQLLVLFVLGSWLALGIGLLVAALTPNHDAPAPSIVPLESSIASRGRSTWRRSPHRLRYAHADSAS